MPFGKRDGLEWFLGKIVVWVEKAENLKNHVLVLADYLLSRLLHYALAIYKKKQLWFQLFYLSFIMGSLTSLSI